MNIALLGPRGTYSEEAAKKYNKDATLTYCKSNDCIFEKVQSGEVDEGVIPIENQLEGTVVENLDLLFEADLHITKEIFLPIHHTLITLPETKKVEMILSHPQALAQCRKYVKERYPDAKLVETPSTASALQDLQPGMAVIGSKIGADLHGLEVKEESIEDFKENATRFLVISKEPSTGKKTSINFIPAGSHEARALWYCLGCFAINNINLTKIESRPIKEKVWEYLFFIDIDGSAEDANVQRALQELEQYTSSLKVLGSYDGTD
ncbi:MAG: prephenate dehydratase [Candidatus Woesearchaeota archaeon]|nr:prephenate dehydratase [Candidatus Woesearchaeota archaeon]